MPNENKISRAGQENLEKRQRSTASPAAHWASLHSHRATVEVLYRNGCKVNVFEAANIDCSHSIPLRIDAFAIRMNPTRLAETVLYDVFVERVRTKTFFRCEQAQLIARQEPQEGTLARADRAVACHRPGEFTFNLECDLAAVTATCVDHVISPCLLRSVSRREAQRHSPDVMPQRLADQRRPTAVQSAALARKACCFQVCSFGRRASEFPHPNTQTAQNDAGQRAWPQRHRMPGHEDLWTNH